jgi:hypothetical protein
MLLSSSILSFEGMIFEITRDGGVSFQGNLTAATGKRAALYQPISSIRRKSTVLFARIFRTLHLDWTHASRWL